MTVQAPNVHVWTLSIKVWSAQMQSKSVGAHSDLGR